MSEPRRTGDGDGHAQDAGTAATGSPLHGASGGRTEMGTPDDSGRHPPHVTENEEGAPIQKDAPGPDVPVVPANASGTDRVPADEQAQPTDPESAYDRRPTQDGGTQAER
jgi:hypothetical protein